jgi:hypothetical protein
MKTSSLANVLEGVRSLLRRGNVPAFRNHTNIAIFVMSFVAGIGSLSPVSLTVSGD